jgi:hypothetical protein
MQVGGQYTGDHRTPPGFVIDDPLGARARRELAVPPRFRRPGAASFRPVTGASRRGMGRAAGLRQPFLPALGRVFAAGREAAFTATGGSLGSRYPALLVSVNALPTG